MFNRIEISEVRVRLMEFERNNPVAYNEASEYIFGYLLPARFVHGRHALDLYGEILQQSIKHQRRLHQNVGA